MKLIPWLNQVRCREISPQRAHPDSYRPWPYHGESLRVA